MNGAALARGADPPALVEAKCALSIAHAGRRRALHAGALASGQERRRQYEEAQRLLRRAVALRNRVRWLTQAARPDESVERVRTLRAA